MLPRATLACLFLFPVLSTQLHAQKLEICWAALVGSYECNVVTWSSAGIDTTTLIQLYYLGKDGSERAVGSPVPVSAGWAKDMNVANGWDSIPDRYLIKSVNNKKYKPSSPHKTMVMALSRLDTIRLTKVKLRWNAYEGVVPRYYEVYRTFEYDTVFTRIDTFQNEDLESNVFTDTKKGKFYRSISGRQLIKKVSYIKDLATYETDIDFRADSNIKNVRFSFWVVLIPEVALICERSKETPATNKQYFSPIMTWPAYVNDNFDYTFYENNQILPEK
jgi:hypothetical protein